MDLAGFHLRVLLNPRKHVLKDILRFWPQGHFIPGPTGKGVLTLAKSCKSHCVGEEGTSQNLNSGGIHRKLKTGIPRNVAGYVTIL